MRYMAEHKFVKVKIINKDINLIMSNKYYYDTEFLEGTQGIKTWFGKVQTEPTIDLISIGIVSDDNREYYAISKDFNLQEAWNRYDYKPYPNENSQYQKVYWIRDNVLKPIHWELSQEQEDHCLSYKTWCKIVERKDGYSDRHYKTLQKLINKYGKTNKQIAQEIKDFVYANNVQTTLKDKSTVFYTYGHDQCFIFSNFMKNYGCL